MDAHGRRRTSGTDKRNAVRERFGTGCGVACTLMDRLPLEGFVFPDRRQWRRQVAALPSGMQDKLAEVVDQLLQSTQLPKSSGHEAYTGWSNLYSVALAAPIGSSIGLKRTARAGQ